MQSPLLKTNRNKITLSRKAKENIYIGVFIVLLLVLIVFLYYRPILFKQVERYQVVNVIKEAQLEKVPIVHKGGIKNVEMWMTDCEIQKIGEDKIIQGILVSDNPSEIPHDMQIMYLSQPDESVPMYDVFTINISLTYPMFLIFAVILLVKWKRLFS